MKLKTTLHQSSVILLLFISVLLLTQCKKEEVDIYECGSDTPTYTNDVKAILDANCATSGCHNSKSKKSGYDFSNYESSRQGADDEAFLGSVQRKSGYSKMPRGGDKLSDTEIKALACWVQNGMPE